MDEQTIFGLIALAEEQQRAVSEAISELGKETRKLTAAAAATGEQAVAASAAAENISRTAAAACSTAVADAMKRAGDTAGKAIENGCSPVVSQLTRASKSVFEAERKLNGAAEKISWKWFINSAALTAAAVIVVCAACWIAAGWSRSDLEELRAEKIKLNEEIKRMQVAANNLAQRGGRVQVRDCGAPARTCVRVDKNAGVFGNDKDGDWMIAR